MIIYYTKYENSQSLHSMFLKILYLLKICRTCIILAFLQSKLEKSLKCYEIITISPQYLPYLSSFYYYYFKDHSLIITANLRTSSFQPSSFGVNDLSVFILILFINLFLNKINRSVLSNIKRPPYIFTQYSKGKHYYA